jgi:pimeloyl-ACP methyl ester carboxylesterase
MEPQTMRTIFKMSCILLASSGLAAAGVPEGKGQFVFTDQRGNPDKPLRVFTYRPASYTAESPIVFVMHGKLRNAEEYRQPWIPLADRYHCLVVSPEFSEQHYPDIFGYNYGNMRTPDDKPIEESKWSFSAVEHLFDHLRAETGSRRERYHIFGHSAGSQFVHRMLFYKPGARFAKAIAANAGSYTFPTAAITFPFGLGGTSQQEDGLGKVFGVPLVVLLGEKDTDPNDELLPREPEAMEQGPHRFARGKKFFAAAKAAAQALKTDFRWTLATVPGVDHDNAKMAPAAARALFETTTP